MTGWKALVVVVGMVAGTSACGDFEVTCDAVSPSELPDGSPPGTPETDRAFGPEMLVWGTDRNAVREGIVEMSPGPGGVNVLQPTPGVLVRGFPARRQAAGDSPYDQPAIIWHENLCQYTVWLDGSLTDAEIVDYAARF